MPLREERRVFISYAHRDGAELAQRLQKDLTKSGFDAWLDTQRLTAGAQWATNIEEEIDARQMWELDSGRELLTLCGHTDWVRGVAMSGDRRLVVHMAETNNLLCGKAAAVPAPKVEEAKDMDSKDKLIAALKASFDFCSDALANMDDSKLAETTEGFGGKQVTRGWLSLILAGSWADHYAEAAMYLRLNGVLPPTAKK